MATADQHDAGTGSSPQPVAMRTPQATDVAASGPVTSHINVSDPSATITITAPIRNGMTKAAIHGTDPPSG
ncbi:MAG TPA: hypothetical protein VG435_03815 [Acidimicrobiales bacterium]|nr:hypothetical protein [Acidimicrobiales bacterium]